MFDVGFLEPMFDDRVSIFGLPADSIVLVIAVVASIAGLVWMRRLLTIEPEAHSFRATSARVAGGRVLLTAGAIVVTFLLAAVVLGALRPG